jgi:hypothetical protein|tara:strand:- start:15794 stop:15991 length:198 start_codon:yes stop_codon:yes gene_type:complete
MDKSTATIKFSKDEINQLIRAIVLRNNVAKSFEKDSEKQAYKKLKDDLGIILNNIIEGEQQVNNS